MAQGATSEQSDVFSSDVFSCAIMCGVVCRARVVVMGGERNSAELNYNMSPRVLRGWLIYTGAANASKKSLLVATIRARTRPPTPIPASRDSREKFSPHSHGGRAVARAPRTHFLLRPSGAQHAQCWPSALALHWLPSSHARLLSCYTLHTCGPALDRVSPYTARHTACER